MPHVLTFDPGLVNRYLADQLSDVECEALEARLTTDPALLCEMEATARFKLALSRLRSEDRLDALVRPWPSPRSWLMGTAAAVALCVFGFNGIHSLENAEPRAAVARSAFLAASRDQRSAVGDAYALFHKRGGAYDASIIRPPSRQWIELRVLPDREPSIDDSYRVAIFRMHAGARSDSGASIAGLKPADDGFVSIFLDSAHLTPGDYGLAVSADTSITPSPDTFVFRVVPMSDR